MLIEQNENASSYYANAEELENNLTIFADKGYQFANKAVEDLVRVVLQCGFGRPYH